MSAPLVKDGSTPEPVHFKLKQAGQSVVALPMSSRALDGYDGPTEEGLQDDLEKIRDVLEDEGRPMPKNAICRLIGRNKSQTLQSINVHVERGFLTENRNGNKHFIGLPGQSVSE